MDAETTETPAPTPTPEAAPDTPPEPTPAEPAPTPEEAPAPEEKPSAPAEKGNPLADIGNAFLGDWPEPQEHFVETVKADVKAAEDQETAAVDFRLLRDSNGHYFDPAICSGKIDPKTGIPEKTVKGMWVLLRGKKRKDLKKKAPQIDSAEVVQSVEQERAALEAQRLALEKQCEMTATVCDSFAWLTIEALTGTGADAPTQKAGKQAVKDWLMTLEEPPQLPVWCVPVFIYGQATFQRFRSDKAAPKRKALREKIGHAWAYLRGKKAARQEQQHKEQSREGGEK